MPSNYELHLSPVSFNWRAESSIQADIDGAVSGAASAVARAKVAAIEAQLRRGDRLYRRRNYEAAVAEYQKARAAIYAIIRPKFLPEFSAQIEDLLLPLNTKIENQLLAASPHVINSVRPANEVHAMQLAPASDSDLPANLQARQKLGFQETKELDSTIRQAMATAYELVVEDRPQAAADLLLTTHREASRNNARPDAGLMASLELNLASTFVQLAETTQGMKFAKSAAARFRRRRDTIGEAQSTHVLGLNQKVANKAKQAKASFKEAANLIERAGQSPSPQPPGRLTIRRAAVPATGRRLDPVAISSVDLARVEHHELSAIDTRSPGVLSLEREVVANQLGNNLTALQAVVGKDESFVPMRLSGRVSGWGSVDLTSKSHNAQRSKDWNIGIPAGDKVITFKTGEQQTIAVSSLKDKIYASRANRTKFSDLNIAVAGTHTTSAYLLQLYAYVLPTKIGDCYHRLGRFQNAENNYRLATKYSFLNKHIEASLLWKKLARNALEWGETLYRQEDIAGAKKQFEKIIKTDGTEPNSFLYSTASLKVPADEARALIANIGNRPLPRINTALSITIMQAMSHLANILAGFDFYGLLLSPIHTFEYLQSIATGFCREVIQSEREFINFKSREELESATRRDLDGAVAMAEAEAAGRRELLRAAEDDELAAKKALDLARKRHTDAIDQRNQYAASSATQIWAQAASQALMGGEDGMYSEISELADKLARGETISGAGPLLAAAQALHAGRKTREYELARMQDNIDQLAVSITVADTQHKAAEHRTNVAELALQAALERVEMAKEALEAFDNEFFTPDAWSAMADVMRDISKSYLYQAIRIAKLMERAYNFENDTSLNVIKAEYGHGVANEAPGRDTRLLAGDALLSDVESFTYHAITTTTRKNAQIKDVISIRNEYPAQFEAFLDTGLLEFETDLYEFDRLHPGFFEQRIEAVEVEVIGVLGSEGINGTLSGGGVTSFRQRNNTRGTRPHIVDTLALSDFELRNDVFLYKADTGVRGLFQGLGVEGSWTLHLPRRSNELDLARIFDIRLSLYYKAKFDTGLRDTILGTPPRPAELEQQRSFALRYDYPGDWYAFYKSASVTVDLSTARFPANQRDFVIRGMRARVFTKAGVSDQDIELRISSPGGTVATAVTTAGGLVSTDDAALSDIIDEAPIGEWTIEVIGGDSLLNDGEIDVSRVHNIQLSFDYGFDYLEEAI